jgi:hypothetical protein
LSVRVESQRCRDALTEIAGRFQQRTDADRAP